MIAIAQLLQLRQVSNQCFSSMFYDKRHSPEAQEWYYRLMNDPEYFEQQWYIDRINIYNEVIEELI